MESELNFYWELIQHDGTRLEIPPDAVDTIKRRLQDALPINTRSMVIPANQVKTFRRTEKPFSSQPLLEDVARAFDEPLLTADGSIQARWVKKQVTQRRWEAFYSPSGYKHLDDANGMVTVAFRLPTHQIDQTLTPYLSEAEISQLKV